VQRIAAATSRAEAERERRRFRLAYQTCYPKAVERLDRDWERLVAYYAFPVTCSPGVEPRKLTVLAR